MPLSDANPTPRVLVLFGATGDLAQRMLFPSLFHLHRDQLLPPQLKIIGVARSSLERSAFKDQVLRSLRSAIDREESTQSEVDAFIDRIDYVPIDLQSTRAFATLTRVLPGECGGRIVFYLSIAPSLYGQVVDGLAAEGLVSAQARVVLEKPIGNDLESSQAINDAVNAVFAESQVFRVDHYLGKETVQNLLALRFGNSLFEPLWNAGGIEQVQITVSETVGLEGRVAYYDGIGALRDMMQNHMLQLLTLVAMEPPADLEPAATRNEKIKVLRSLRPITGDDVKHCTVAGQYEAGTVGGAGVPGYREELGRNSSTETFVALKARIDNWRWAGVPFYLRTGKRMPTRYSEIFIQFKSVPHSIFASRGGALTPNKLVIRLQPEENIRLLVMAKEPGLEKNGICLREVALDLSLTQTFPTGRRRYAYERLIHDVIEGNGTLFVRRDEVEAAWSWVDGVVDGWRKFDQAPEAYAAGSWGPAAAVALPERDGHRWHT